MLFGLETSEKMAGSHCIVNEENKVFLLYESTFTDMVEIFCVAATLIRQLPVICKSFGGLGG